MKIINKIHNGRAPKFFRAFLTIAPLFAVFAFIGLSGAFTKVNAQNSSNQSVCKRFKFEDTKVNLDGVWALTFGTNGAITVTLVIKGQAATSLSSYYSSNIRRNRRVSQTHRLCESGTSIVILGFNPVDIDTNEKGSAFGYAADNYFITLRSGTVYAYNVDDAGNKSDIAIKFVGELPSD